MKPSLIRMARRTRDVLILLLCFHLWSCSKSDSVVQWPALKHLDEWAEKGEGWSEEGKVAEMRQNLPALRKAVEDLLASPVPANAKDPGAVKLVLSDLKDLDHQLSKTPLSDDELKVQVASLHPIVERLMGAAGLPHVHEHEEKK